MNKRSKLMTEILLGQDRADGAFDEQRIRSALAGNPPLSVEERLLLWSSPDARDHFLSVRRQFRRELAEEIRSADLGYSEHRLAAAGGERDVQEVPGKGFSVMIFHDDLPGEEWSISCQLDAAYLQILPPRTVVTLRDTGGLIWASGIPDDLGRFDEVWRHMGETPAERLKRNSLWLEP